MVDKTIVPYNSDEAASYQQVSGWVSRDGRWWGKDERAARYAGCTHTPCLICGTLVEKGHLHCPPCQKKIERDQYLALERREWDRKTPLALWDGSAYFFHVEDLCAYVEEHTVDISDLLLVWCTPVGVPHVSALELLEDYLGDDMDDSDVPADVHEAVTALNAALKAHGTFAWYPSNIAAVVPEVVLRESKLSTQTDL